MSEETTPESIALMLVAGNIAAGLMDRLLVLLDGHIDNQQSDKIAKFSVSLARSIVAEVQRPVPAPPEP